MMVFCDEPVCNLSLCAGQKKVVLVELLGAERVELNLNLSHYESLLFDIFLGGGQKYGTYNLVRERVASLGGNQEIFNAEELSGATWMKIVLVAKEDCQVYFLHVTKEVVDADEARQVDAPAPEDARPCLVCGELVGSRGSFNADQQLFKGPICFDCLSPVTEIVGVFSRLQELLARRGFERVDGAALKKAIASIAAEDKRAAAAKSACSSALQKHMVHEQNRAMGYPDEPIQPLSRVVCRAEETAWFRGVHGDGTPFESPWPTGKGWEEIERQRWQPGEAIFWPHPGCDPREGRVAVRDRVVPGGEFFLQYELVEEAQRAWECEVRFDDHVERQVTTSHSVLEARRFRRNVSVEDESSYVSVFKYF